MSNRQTRRPLLLASPHHASVFLVSGADLRLYSLERPGGDGEGVVQPLLNLKIENPPRCISWCPSSARPYVVAVGTSTGKVVLHDCSPDLDLGAGGGSFSGERSFREFLPQSTRTCHDLRWNCARPELIATGLEKISRTTVSCVLIWDVERRGVPVTELRAPAGPACMRVPSGGSLPRVCSLSALPSSPSPLAPKGPGAWPPVPPSHSCATGSDMGTRANSSESFLNACGATGDEQPSPAPLARTSFRLASATSVECVTEPAFQFSNGEEAKTVSWMPESPLCLAVGTGHKWLRIYDTRDRPTANQHCVAHNRAIYGLEFSPHHPHLVATFSDEGTGVVKVWDTRYLEDYKPAFALQLPGASGKSGKVDNPLSIGWCPQRQGLLAVAQERSVTIWATSHLVADSAARTEEPAVPMVASDASRCASGMQSVGTVSSSSERTEVSMRLGAVAEDTASFRPFQATSTAAAGRLWPTMDQPTRVVDVVEHVGAFCWHRTLESHVLVMGQKDALLTLVPVRSFRPFSWGTHRTSLSVALGTTVEHHHAESTADISDLMRERVGAGYGLDAVRNARVLGGRGKEAGGLPRAMDTEGIAPGRESKGVRTSTASDDGCSLGGTWALLARMEAEGSGNGDDGDEGRPPPTQHPGALAGSGWQRGVLGSIDAIAAEEIQQLPSEGSEQWSPSLPTPSVLIAATRTAVEPAGPGQRQRGARLDAAPYGEPPSSPGVLSRACKSLPIAKLGSGPAQPPPQPIAVGVTTNPQSLRGTSHEAGTCPPFQHPTSCQGIAGPGAGGRAWSHAGSDGEAPTLTCAQKMPHSASDCGLATHVTNICRQPSVTSGYSGSSGDTPGAGPSGDHPSMCSPSPASSVHLDQVEGRSFGYHFYTSPSRRAVLRICGWPLAETLDRFAAAMKSWTNSGRLEAAAFMAFLHGDLASVVEVLEQRVDGGAEAVAERRAELSLLAMVVAGFPFPASPAAGGGELPAEGPGGGSCSGRSGLQGTDDDLRYGLGGASGRGGLGRSNSLRSFVSGCSATTAQPSVPEGRTSDDERLARARCPGADGSSPASISPPRQRSPAPPLWSRTVKALVPQVRDPYLRAILTLLSSSHHTAEGALRDILLSSTPGATSVTEQGPRLPLQAGVALACRLLPARALADVLGALVAKATQAGRLEGVLLTGRTGPGVLPLLQAYVDTTGDVQTASLVSAPLLAVASSEQVRAWLQAYRELLNRWQLWVERARLDCALASQHISMGATGASCGGAPSPRLLTVLSSPPCPPASGHGIPTYGRAQVRLLQLVLAR